MIWLDTHHRWIMGRKQEMQKNLVFWPERAPNRPSEGNALWMVKKGLFTQYLSLFRANYGKKQLY